MAQTNLGGENYDGFESLLTKEEVIRDPVHKDIWVTELEKDILDDERFQRLKRIRQLGTAHFVYPGANHTRFEHSLGTLYMAQQIIDSVNKKHNSGGTYFSCYTEIKIPPEDIFITRLVALMHDIDHLPYGHTLEDKGQIFTNSQWTDKDRGFLFDHFFNIIDKHMKDENIPKDKREEISKIINDTLKAEEKGEEAIESLDRPYIADIVGNTICADLLDYVQRDAYYIGLDVGVDSRIMSHFILVNYNKDPRLGIAIEKGNGKLIRSVVSDCIDLLKTRYSLAEKAHWNDTKIRFSAMVIRSVYCAIETEIIDKEDLLELDDDALIQRIIKSSKSESKVDEEPYYSEAAYRLADALRNRRKYVELWSNNEEKASLQEGINPEKRDKFSRALEETVDATPGSVVVYAPPKDTGKAAEAKMIRRGDGEKLENIIENQEVGHKQKEFKAINEGFEELWQLYVLVDEKEFDQVLDNEIIIGKLEDSIKKWLINDDPKELIRTRRYILDDQGEDVIAETDLPGVYDEIEMTTAPSDHPDTFIHGMIDPLLYDGDEGE
ncbi:MAG: HD domain-containing protein [Halobacteriales archaeon]|nr:HD domain-containing protein [Halobacteriales archaeon]